MEAMILCSICLPAVVTFLDWLFPRLEDRTREKFEDWYLKFSDLDYRSIGPFMASLVTRRLDETFGVRSVGLRFMLVTAILSQVLFALIFLSIATAWGMMSSGSILSVPHLFSEVVDRLGHALVPLLAINTIGDMMSLYVTRHLLKRAADARGVLVFGFLMALDASCAIILAAVTFFVFSQFFFADSFSDSLAAFVLNGSLLYVVLIIVAVGVFFVFTGIQQKNFRWWFIGLGSYIVWISILGGIKIAESRPYSGLLSFELDDVATVLVLAVSATAGIPTLLGLFLLLLLFFMNILAKKLHAWLAGLLLFVAETKKGIFAFCSVVFTALSNVLVFIYFAE